MEFIYIFFIWKGVVRRACVSLAAENHMPFSNFELFDSRAVQWSRAWLGPAELHSASH